MTTENKETHPMTIKDFEELGVLNYALGKYKGKFGISIIRVKGDPPLKKFPDLDKDSFECTKELYNKLTSTE